jgi:putative Ca2+/H+ antiporter (TMEM165/GDT1 family)
LTLTALASVFALVFVGELPDKTMFASLVMATRGRPVAVWAGAAAAFVVHVAIAVTIGVAVLHLFGHRVVEVVVAVTFAAGAVLSFASRNVLNDEASPARPPGDSASRAPEGWNARRVASTPAVRTASTAAAVIFVAEWGDRTQIIIANLAARYRDPVPVALASLAALWVVAALAVVGGKGLLAVVSVRTLRICAAVILACLAIYSGIAATGLLGG